MGMVNDRRSQTNRLRRALCDSVVAKLAAARTTAENAGRELERAGVPFAVQCRLVSEGLRKRTDGPLDFRTG